VPESEQPVSSVARLATVLLASLVVLACNARGNADPKPDGPIAIRVGIGGLPSQSPERGLQQLLGNISQEGLLRVNQEGRVESWLAQGWDTSADGLRVTLRLRPNVFFHDGSVADAAAIAAYLTESLPKSLRSAFEDVKSISAADKSTVVIDLQRPSTFVTEVMTDVPIQKPGNASVGTGPFLAPKTSASSQSAEMARNETYYLGPAEIHRIAVNTYANTRAAWADMLRDKLDVLYEIDIDAIDSMRASSKVALYTFDRPYQYMVVLNAQSPKLQSAQVRRALNQAIDRAAVVRDGLAGQGTPSAGPVSQHHWAFHEFGTTFTFAPESTKLALAPLRRTNGPGSPTIKCLTLPGLAYERLALVVKKQLEAVGVDMEIEEVPPDRLASTLRNHEYEAALLDPASGPSMFRLYRAWTQTVNLSNPRVTAALDRIRHAVGTDAYRDGVMALQQTMADDPPAIFLAWGSRTRAVTRKFDVQAEPGRDIMSTLRMWKPSADNRNATDN